MFILIVWWIRQWVRVIYMWFFFGVCEVYCLMVIYEYFVINMWLFVYVYVKLIYMWFVLKSSVSFVINECLKYIRVSVWFWRWWVRVLVHANFVVGVFEVCCLMIIYSYFVMNWSEVMHIYVNTWYMWLGFKNNLRIHFFRVLKVRVIR